jgi:hypothetical protein
MTARLTVKSSSKMHARVLCIAHPANDQTSVDSATYRLEDSVLVVVAKNLPPPPRSGPRTSADSNETMSVYVPNGGVCVGVVIEAQRHGHRQVGRTFVAGDQERVVVGDGASVSRRKEGGGGGRRSAYGQPHVTSMLKRGRRLDGSARGEFVRPSGSKCCADVQTAKRGHPWKQEFVSIAWVAALRCNACEQTERAAATRRNGCRWWAECTRLCRRLRPNAG